LFDQIAFLRIIVGRLQSEGIPYMLTGSVAMSFYAQPRMTRDIDLVVECRGVESDVWVRLFGADCYVSREAVEDAMRRGGMFNIIDNESLAKADIIVRRDEEYRHAEFERRQRRNVNGLDVDVVTPEDLLLSKLLWWKEGDSPVQRLDLQGLIHARPDLDRAYLEKWADRLGVDHELRELLG